MRSFIVSAAIFAGLLFLALEPTSAREGEWVWTESDWSGGAHAQVDSIEAELAPGELVLAADPTRFVLAFDASERAGIWALAARRDTLYLGACDDPMSIDGGDILAYDLGRDELWLEYEVFEQGIAVLRTHGGTVYSPGVDSMGSHAWGNIYLDDGDGWVRKETVPQAVHVDDIIEHDGRLWVTTGLGSPDLRGLLYASDDAGETWTEEFALLPDPDQAPFRRLYGLARHGGSLFVQSDFNPPEGAVLYEFDGVGTIVHEIDASQYCLAGFAEFQGKLLCMTRTLLNVYDGASWSSQYLGLWSSNFSSRAVIGHGGRAYVGGFQSIKSSADLANWDDATLEPASGREIKGFERYHGRLWAGSLGGGELYVSAGALSGLLVTSVHTYPGLVCGAVLDWDADTPPGTGLEIRIRSANLPENLAVAPFLGPDGTTGSGYVVPGQAIAAAHCGHTLFQLSVTMVSATPRLTPILRKFTLDALPLTTAAPAGNVDRWGLAVWPNPLVAGASIRLPDAPPPGARLTIYDAMGRRLREFSELGDAVLRWDGRDAAGRRLPAGSYHVRLSDGNDRSLAVCRVVLLH